MKTLLLTLALVGATLVYADSVRDRGVHTAAGSCDAKCMQHCDKPMSGCSKADCAAHCSKL